MRILSALAIASVTLLAMSLPARALTFKSGESKSFGKDSGGLESKDRGKGNPNWHLSIKTKLHVIDITGASFQYVDEVFEHALAVFKLDEVPTLGLNVVGESTDPNMEIPEVDCKKHLKNMASDFPERHDDPSQLQSSLFDIFTSKPFKLLIGQSCLLDRVFQKKAHCQSLSRI